MKDERKTKQVLIRELQELRKKTTAGESSEDVLRKTDEALRESEARFRNLMDYLPCVSVQGYRTDGTVVYWNRASEEIYGYKAEEALGRNLGDLIIPLQLIDVFKEGLSLGAKVKTSGEFSPAEELLLLRKDGSLVPVYSIHTAVCVEGKEPLLFCIDVDLREQKRREEILRESEKRYRFLAEDMDAIAFVLDMDMRTTYVSPSVEKVLGFTVEERMKQSPQEQLTPESFNLAIETLSAELMADSDESADPNRAATLELEYYHKDGSIRSLEAFIRGGRDDSGRLTSLYGMARDITEKKRLERELLHAKKLDSLGILAGGIAHDFNNLLMGIQGFASLMKMKIDPSHPHYEKLTRIEDQTRSGAMLTKQLLGFARGGRYEITSTNMNSLVEKTVAMFGRTRKDININIDLAKDLWTVEVDQGQMEQVLMNLLVNACQAMPQGGDLFLKTANAAIGRDKGAPHGVKPGKYIKISVADTGIGMNEKTRERIFDPFFTTKKIGRGTGLGLATAYGIITGHEGIIDVVSEPGQGATFTVYLPASGKAVAPEEAAIPEIIKGTGGILVVDDEEVVLEVSEGFLESLGYRVYLAGSGQEAIAIYREKKDEISLVILDMIMPGISGGETFDQLREINPEVKVILASGYSANEQAQEILDRGCRGFLQKPFRVQEISQKVRQVLTS